MSKIVSLKPYADLGLRILLIGLTTVILTAVTENINYDVHLAIRKAQDTDGNITILEVDNLYQLRRALQSQTLAEAKQILLYENAVIDSKLTPNLLFYSTTSLTSKMNALPFHLRADADGQIRRFTFNGAPNSLSKVITNPRVHELFKAKKNVLINFRGPNFTFSRNRLFGFDHEKQKSLTGKTVIIFNRLNPKNLVTPLGPMDESEVIANLVDNFYNYRFVQKTERVVQLITCGILLIISIVIILYLPAFLALIGTAILFLLYFSVSLFLFDKLYLWSPFLTPMIQIVMTYILISNYKYMLNENTKWKLERKSRYMREVEEMKSNFLGLFSHDLKTPLAKVIGISETLLTDPSLSPDHNTELRKIRTYSRDLEKYLKRIIKTSQLQSEKVSLMKSQGDVNLLIQKCIQKMIPLADEKKITIKIEKKPLFLIDFDHQLIEEVLFNFIENAIHYSPESGTITVRSCEVGDFVKVSVSDQGPGIAKELQDKVWNKFFRLETKKQGYGLGLYLSKYVIELHRGRVYLQSETGNGSEFGFLIPMSGDPNE